MDNSKKGSKQDLQAEKDLINETFFLDSGHWTAHPFLCTRERFWLKYDVQKIRFYGALYRYISQKPYKNCADILFAPVGDGRDYAYLEGMYKQVHGIDISPKQLSKCPRAIVTKEADILNSGYADGSFDIVIVSLFMHHLSRVSFEPYIREFRRILRANGVIAIMEPSSLYPVSWLVACATRILGKIPAKVDDEWPVYPPAIRRAIEKNGFKNIRVHGMTFNHVVIPSFFQSVINAIDYPLRIIHPFKLFSESIAYFAQKA